MADYSTSNSSGGIGLVIGGIVVALFLLYIILAAGNGSVEQDPSVLTEPATSEAAPAAEEAAPATGTESTTGN